MPVGWETVVGGLAFPECPRWHDGALWVTDVAAGEIVRISEGRSEVVCRVDEHPAGTGWLPDGRLLIAAGATRRLLRLESDGSLVEHADLTGLATHLLNDMLVDPQGRAYVGNYGDDSVPPAPPFPAVLSLVEPDGTTRAAAADLRFANGMALTSDGTTLVVAETRATPGCLTAFTVAADGSLGDRRTLTEFADGVLPDGIALAGDGSIWVASPFSNEVIHVDPAGAVVESLSVPTPYAVAVGGADLDQLFVCSAPTWMPDEALRLRQGSVLCRPLGH